MEEMDGASPVPAHTETADLSTNIGFTDGTSDWWAAVFKIHSSTGKDTHDAVNSTGYRGGKCSCGYTCTMPGGQVSRTSFICC